MVSSNVQNALKVLLCLCAMQCRWLTPLSRLTSSSPSTRSQHHRMGETSTSLRCENARFFDEIASSKTTDHETTTTHHISIITCNETDCASLHFTHLTTAGAAGAGDDDDPAACASARDGDHRDRSAARSRPQLQPRVDGE